MMKVAAAVTIRNIIFAILGALGLVMKHSYNGPFTEIILSYGGNFVVSLALYFAALSGAIQAGFGRTGAAVATLLAVEAFEITNGFGFMSNTYDPWDLLANAAGIGMAVLLDRLTEPLVSGAGAN